MKRQKLDETDIITSEQTDVNCQEVITSDDYIDVVREINTSLGQNDALCIQKLNERYAVYHIPRNGLSCDQIYKIQPYVEVPNIYGLYGKRAIDASGITPVTTLPTLALTGRDVIIGIVDTGIDYTHPAFIYEDDTSKILSIWDQTGVNSPPDGFLFGTEYTNEQINQAILADDPFSFIPQQDEIGHGTFLAGVAAGRENQAERFIGAAPDASLVVVKLKQAKNCLREFYSIKKDAIGFQNTDVILGVNYILKKAQQFQMPVVILLGLGDNMGPHNGETFTETVLEQYSNLTGVVVTVAAGNEANKSHHYLGQFDEEDTVQSVQFNVPENEIGFYINIWYYTPDKITISLTSPRGTSTGRIPPRPEQKQEITFIAESTEILVEYAFVEARTGDVAIFIRLKNPSPGIWTLNLFGEVIINGRYDIWLPREGFAEDETIFLLPDPFTTVTSPATNSDTITIGGYNDMTSSLYIPSGRGLTRGGIVKPDLVAPGVNVIGPLPRGLYGSMSGTSVSTAITAGASALLLQWGIVNGNDPDMDTVAVKTLLIRGAKRRPALQYPNREWGFGELDLFNSFALIER